MYSIRVDDGELDTLSLVRDIVAWLALMTKSDDVPEGRNVVPNKKAAVPFLDPVKRLSSMCLDEALCAGDWRLETVHASVYSRTPINAAIAGCSDRGIVLHGQNCMLNVLHVSYKLIEEDCGLL